MEHDKAHINLTSNMLKQIGDSDMSRPSSRSNEVFCGVGRKEKLTKEAGMRGEKTAFPHREIGEEINMTRRSPLNSSASIDLKDISFDPKSPELTTTWFTNRRYAITLNAYPNGVTLSVHKNPEVTDSQDSKETIVPDNEEEKIKSFLPTQFHLRLKDTRDYLVPQGRYSLIRERLGENLEKQLHQLKDQDILRNSVLYFGMATDPFYAFPKKFEVTMKCIELLERYQPAMLVLQSRSPMIVSALPILKHFNDRAVAVIPVESSNERVIQQYTPGQATIVDRLVAADGLRKQGIKVNLQVSPVLPYGDFYRDAWPFAELLAEHADYITLGCLATGAISDEPILKNLSISKHLNAEKMYRWLRPYAYRYLFHALQIVAPNKLLVPVKGEIKQSQLSLFAA